MPVLDDAIGVGVLGTELDDDGSIRATFGGGCILRCSIIFVESRKLFDLKTCAAESASSRIQNVRRSKSHCWFHQRFRFAKCYLGIT